MCILSETSLPFSSIHDGHKIRLPPRIGEKPDLNAVWLVFILLVQLYIVVANASAKKSETTI